MKAQEILGGYVSEMLNLVEGFRRTIALHPSAGMVHVASDGTEQTESYGQLLERGARVLTGLRAQGLKAGDKLLLQTDRSDDFVAAFWGCLLGGIVPAPLSVPASYKAQDQEYRKFANVYDLLEAPLVACAENLEQEFVDLASEQIKDLRYATISDLLMYEPAESFHRADHDDLAFLMFSSGSTGVPKGVCLSHGNLLHNILQIADRGALHAGDVSVSWLPFSHDMGLILFHLTHALCGITQVKMGHFSFVRRPEMFLEKIAIHGGTITGCPNFAFYHLLHEVDDRVLEDLDLSSLRILYNGAEPISAEICRQFLDRYCEQTDLPRSVIFPGYGIAEACVCATVHAWGSELSSESCPSLWIDARTFALEQKAVPPQSECGGMEIVNLGEPMPGMTARIVDPQGHALADGNVGRIQFKGPNVSQGYYNNPEANQALFVDGWLDTGDLGFIHERHVYITGRAKDIIFINGQNFYAHDVESVLIESCEIPLGHVVVVGYHDKGLERIAAFFVHRRKLATCLDKVRSIREAIAEHFKFDIHSVLPVRKIPKTTSGKLQRYQLVQNLLDGAFAQTQEKLTVLLKEQKRVQGTQLEASLAKITAKRFGLEVCQLCMDKPLIEMGNDSIQMVRLLDDLRDCDAHPVLATLKIRDLYVHNTIGKLARYLEEGAHCTADVSLEASVGPRYELSHAQKQVYAATRMFEATTLYNETYACTLQGEVDGDLLEEAFSAVISRYSSLRTVFGEEDGVPFQEIVDEVTFQLERREGATIAEVEAAMVADAALPLPLDKAPLLHACLYTCEKDTCILYVKLHHLVIDGTAFGIFFSVLSEAYEALSTGAKLTEAEQVRPVDYYHWHNQQLQTERCQKAGDYWTELFKDHTTRTTLPTTGEHEGQSGAGVFSTTLTPELMSTLKRGATQHHWTFYQICLSGYLLLNHYLSGSQDVVVGTTASGRLHRQSGDLLGYLANTLAVRLQVDSAVSLGSLVNEVKAQAQESFEHSEFPIDLFYGRMNRQANTAGSPLFSTVFSMFESPVSNSSLPFGEIRFLRHEAKVDLLLNVERRTQDLCFHWEYDAGKFSREDIVNWHGTLTGLLELVCEQPQAQVFSAILESSSPYLPDWLLPREDKTLGLTSAPQFAKEPKRPGLSLLRDRTSGQQAQGLGCHDWELCPDITRRLTALAIQKKATLEDVCLAAYLYTLHTLTGTSWVGTLRNPQETSTALATEIKKDHRLSFNDLITQVRASRITWQVSGRAVDTWVDTGFAFQRYPTPDLWSQEVAHVGLDLFAVVSWQGTLKIRFTYAKDLFAVRTVKRWLSQYAHLLDVASAQPSAWIASLDLIPASQKAVLSRFNMGVDMFVPEGRLQDFVDVQARQTPERTALYWNGQTTSYAWLSKASDGIAEALQEQGVTAGERIACIAQQSPLAIAGILGILKAGCTYLVQDSSVWQASFLARNNVKVAVVDQEVLNSEIWRPILAGMYTTVCLETTWATTRSGPKRVEDYGSEVPACIFQRNIFEDVTVSHQEARTTFLGLNTTVGTMGKDRFLCSSALSDPESLYDLFGAFACGGEVVLPTNAERMNPYAFLNLIETRGVTAWKTTAHLALQLITARRGQCESLQLLMLTGSIDATLPAELHRCFPNVRIASLTELGENGLWQTYYYPITHVPQTWEKIPAGWPLPAQGLTVVNNAQKPCTIDQPGKLYRMTRDGAMQEFGAGKTQWARIKPEGYLELLDTPNKEIHPHNTSKEAEKTTASTDETSLTVYESPELQLACQ